ncbi:hypothetical protein HHI36_001914 [Cryptolaemus montrouzieri]|uniref:Uncharacterized protein n=1 Tax=Cryptolaemus montrouzieri TaxID=559131 RepID=A0ABD2P934_9CUCU
MQKSTFTTLTMHTIYQSHLEIIGQTSKFAEIDPSKSIFRYGRLLARSEVASVWPDIRYLFNIPDSAYILNPYIKDRSRVTSELALLYQQYLKQHYQEKIEPQQNHFSISTMDKKESIASIIDRKKSFESVKINITRLLISLPCLCNKTINDNFSQFMEAKDENDFNNYLTIFLEALIKIAVNLLNSEPAAIQLLQNYMQKFYRTKIIDSYTKELEARIFKMGHIVREFLKTHQLTNIKECFEREFIAEKNDKCEEIIQAWLKKSKMNCSKTVRHIPVEKNKTSGIYHSFFKYCQDKTEGEESSVNLISDTRDKQVKKLPEIDEIIEGMMVPPDSKTSRNIPHINELACLLTKDKFPELNRDEIFLEELRSHFITQYPILEGFVIDNVDGLRNLSVMQKLFDSSKKEHLDQYVQRHFLIEDPNKIGMMENILENGGDESDLCVTKEILAYVYTKGVLGATGNQLKVYS